MPKPINWSLLDRLMRKHYPKEYQRILAENGRTTITDHTDHTNHTDHTDQTNGPKGDDKSQCAPSPVNPAEDRCASSRPEPESPCHAIMNPSGSCPTSTAKISMSKRTAPSSTVRSRSRKTRTSKSDTSATSPPAPEADRFRRPGKKSRKDAAIRKGED